MGIASMAAEPTLRPPLPRFGSMGDVWAGSNTVHMVDGGMLGLGFSCFGSRGDALCSRTAGPGWHQGLREEREAAPEAAACVDGHTWCLETQVRGSCGWAWKKYSPVEKWDP